MGVEYELYCKDCKEGYSLGKWSSELAEASIKGVGFVKALWRPLVRNEKGRMFRIIPAKSW